MCVQLYTAGQTKLYTHWNPLPKMNTLWKQIIVLLIIKHIYKRQSLDVSKLEKCDETTYSNLE